MAPGALALLAITFGGAPVVPSNVMATEPANHSTLYHSVSVEVNGEKRESQSRVLFSGPYAISVPPKNVNGDQDNYLPVVFNLDKKCWYDFNERKWVSKSDWKRAERLIIERFEKALEAASSDEEKQFIREGLTPEFKITASNSTLTVEGKFVSYDIVAMPNISEEDRSRFYKYDRLNAIHKAMQLQRLPAGTQLKLDELLHKRNIMPKSISMTMNLPATELLNTPPMKLSYTSSFTLRKPTTEETETTSKYLEALPPFDEEK